jgi:hypothetical protein
MQVAAVLSGCSEAPLPALSDRLQVPRPTRPELLLVTERKLEATAQDRPQARDDWQNKTVL